jgi:heptosyltransferase-2
LKAHRNKPEILVIRGGAIGDFILTLPVLAALRQQFPAVKLTLLGYPRIAELARAGGLVDEVKAIESPGLAGFFARSGQCTPEWQAFFSRFEIILSYLYDPDGLFEANVKRCQPRQYLSGPFRPPETGCETEFREMAFKSVFLWNSIYMCIYYDHE